jgi:histidine triad (HIT) family protein
MKKRNLLIFEDPDVSAYLTQSPTSVAHVIVAPKKHFANINEVPDYMVAWTFAIANKISKVMLESIGMQGINLISEIGSGALCEHFYVNIIPRFEKDSLNLKWNPHKGEPDDLKTTMLMYGEETKNMAMISDKPKQPEAPPAPTKVISGKEDYRIKQLHRMP